MDATTQFALIAKAQILFGGNGKLLSFPLDKLQFTKQKLAFMSDLNVSNLIEFSSLVNRIPTGEIWSSGGECFLDDIYQEVLSQGNLAESTRTPAEEAEYQSACSYLKESSTGKDSLVYTTYKEFKDFNIINLQRYMEAKLTAESSTDSVFKKKWEEDDPAARKVMEECERRWVIEGYKNQVENAINKQLSLGARFPSKTWEEWKTKFNPDIDTANDAKNLQQVYPAVFSPTNALDEASWQPCTVTGDEVRKFVSEGATGELLSRFSFGLDDIDPSVSSLSFEYSSVTIIRPWFKKEAFETRFWRFSDQLKVLSDGAVPASGICPAYVTAVVFARNLKITKKGTLSPPDVSLGSPQLGIAQQPISEQIIAIERQIPFSDVDSSIIPTNDLDEAIKYRDILLSQLEALRPHRTVNPSMMQSMHALEAQYFASLQLIEMLKALENESFSRIVNAETIVTTAPSSSSPELDEHIYILAFICKSLPKCPNPDPALKWPF